MRCMGVLALREGQEVQLCLRKSKLDQKNKANRKKQTSYCKRGHIRRVLPLRRDAGAPSSIRQMLQWLAARHSYLLLSSEIKSIKEGVLGFTADASGC